MPIQYETMVRNIIDEPKIKIKIKNSKTAVYRNKINRYHKCIILITLDEIFFVAMISAGIVQFVFLFICILYFEVGVGYDLNANEARSWVIF